MKATKSQFLSLSSETNSLVILPTKTRMSAFLHGGAPVNGVWITYQITFGNFVYVGSTGQILTRLANHTSRGYQKTWSKHRLYSEMQNADGVSIAITHCASKEEAKEQERFLIDFYRAQTGLQVLNQRLGARPSDEEIESNKVKIKTKKAVYEKGGFYVYNDNFCQRFDSVTEAAKVLGLYPTNLSSVLKGRLKSTGGYYASRVPSRKLNRA